MKNKDAPEHALEFLLAFDGYRHHYPEGYYTNFERVLGERGIPLVVIADEKVSQP